MAYTEGVATAPNGNYRIVGITGNLDGNGTPTWEIHFLSRWALRYNNLLCQIRGATTSDVRFNYNGTNIWVSATGSFNTGGVGLGGSTTLTVYITVPAVGSTAATTSVASLELSRAAQIPSAPGQPSISEITPTSCRVQFSASTYDNGSGIDGYLLRYWPNSSASGSYVDHSFSGYGDRTVTGLTPGQVYTFGVYARNGVGYSPVSFQTTIRTLAGAWIKTNGVWKLATPLVKVDGSWRNSISYVKVNGSWKNTG